MTTVDALALLVGVLIGLPAGYAISSLFRALIGQVVVRWRLARHGLREAERERRAWRIAAGFREIEG